MFSALFIYFFILCKTVLFLFSVQLQMKCLPRKYCLLCTCKVSIHYSSRLSSFKEITFSRMECMSTVWLSSLFNVFRSTSDKLKGLDQYYMDFLNFVLLLLLSFKKKKI